ncbi:MAG: flippase-like domain-containing protein, partial [Acidimicrobiia bacterium]|nr:flippase-like domain-containing protein [Acidimicrobiia bacterium]
MSSRADTDVVAATPSRVTEATSVVPARPSGGGWIRAAEDDRERRPGDVARVAVGVIGLLFAGLWAHAHAGGQSHIFELFNGLPPALEGFAKAVYALGSLWAVFGVVLLLLAFRKWSVALVAALAGVGAWGAAELIHHIVGVQALDGLSIHVRTSARPTFPGANVAVASAVAIALAPYLVRAARLVALAVIVLIAMASMYLGAALLSDVIGGLFLGLAIAGAVRVLFGAPGGRPSSTEVREALDELGLAVTDLQPVPGGPSRASLFDTTLVTGQRARIYAFGRDQRDAQLAAKVWRWIMYREPGIPVFGNRVQEVEHIAFGMMLAGHAGVPVPEVIKTGAAGSASAILATSAPVGRPLAELSADEVSDTMLASIWKQADVLHGAGISHGHLDAEHIVVDGDAFALDDFNSVDTTGNRFWRERDSATLLTSTALLVGHARAIGAATRTLGKDRVGELIPMVQPASLPARAARGATHLAKQLKQLRTDLTEATGAEDLAPLRIRRLSLVDLGMLAGVLIALAVLIPSLTHIDYASVAHEFATADWGWIAFALLLYPLIPTAWGLALMGAVNAKLPVVPTMLTQLAAGFLNLVTPNGVGGTALQIDYLHRRDIPVVSATTAYMISTGVGGVVSTILLVVAASLSSTSLNLSANRGTVGLWLVALVAAAVGVVLLIPKIRGKVVPAVKRAAQDAWAVLRNPTKALQLVGGNVLGTLLYPIILGLCLLAFGHHLGFAQLVVVQIGAGILGAVA